MPVLTGTLKSASQVPIQTEVAFELRGGPIKRAGYVQSKTIRRISTNAAGQFTLNLDGGDYYARWYNGTVQNADEFTLPEDGGPYDISALLIGANPVDPTAGWVLEARNAFALATTAVTDAGHAISSAAAAAAAAAAANATASAVAGSAAGFPVVDFRGTITTLGTDPGAAASNSGKWWQIGVAGTLSHGNAGGLTVAVGDRILSNGTAWLKYVTPPTYIPSGSVIGDQVASLTIPQRALATRAVGLPQLDGVPVPVAVPENSAGIAYAITDVAGQVLFGLKANGDIVNPAHSVAAETALRALRGWGSSAQMRLVPPMAEGIEFALTDPSGKVLFGIKSDAQIINPGLELATARAAAALPRVASMGNPNNIEFAITDRDGKVLLGFRADGSVVSAEIQSAITALGTALQKSTVQGNSANIEFAITDRTGQVLLGFLGDGTPISAYDARLQALELGSSAAQVVDCIPIYGQSNSHGAMDYSQTWRTPYAWGNHPPGYSGPLDGASTVTGASVGLSRTLSGDRGSLVTLLGNAYGFFGSTDLAHGLCDSIATAYPLKRLVTFSHGVGGTNIEYLNKPSSSEISAGSASGITINSGHAEYKMQIAGQTMASVGLHLYSECATPYYKGMWLIDKVRRLAAAEGRVCKVPALVWIHGESDQGHPGYRDLLLALYATYNADVKAITGQPEDLTLLTDAFQYSDQGETATGPGSAWQAFVDSGYDPNFDDSGPLGLYTPEASRINGYRDFDARLWTASKDGPELSPPRKVVLVGVRYPFTSRIHMAPHEHRALGEQYGKVLRKVCYEGRAWRPLEPVSWWIDGAAVFIRFNVPKAPLQFALAQNVTTHTLLAGKPYGFEHSAGTIQQANVTIVGNDLVKIVPDVAPAAGQQIRYVYACRYGSLCDSDQTTPLYADRNAVANVLRNYAVPFVITL